MRRSRPLPVCYAAALAVAAGSAGEARAEPVPALIDGPATPFSAGRGAASERECLATAIAYEAGYEPEIGRRAVADVILNRTRSGLHPATVCGVVYEGSQRRTGCQFTFTCDGSLRRALPARVIDEARRIADTALARLSPSPVGDAINYHADYVHPYWAPTMQRVTQIGRHIFYRAPAGFAPVLPVLGPEPTVARPARPQPAFAPWGLSLPRQP